MISKFNILNIKFLFSIYFTLLSIYYLNLLISFFKASLSPEKSSLTFILDLIYLALFANYKVDIVSYY